MTECAPRRWPAVLAVAIALACAVVACGDRSEIPVHRVAKESFVHKVSADGVLEAGRTTKVSVPPHVRRSVRLAWLLPEGSRVGEGELVASFDPKAMQEKLADAEIDLSRSDREIDRSTVEKDKRIGELHTDAEIADLELHHAREYQKTDTDVFSRRELLEDAIDEQLASERKHHAEENAVTEQRLARTELELLEISQRQAKDDMEEANDGLAALEVRAPHSGMLIYVRDWRGDAATVGREIFRGQNLAEIPDLESLQAELWVLEADAGGLAAGQRAEVVVEAFPDRVLAGEIERVEPVAQPRFRGSPVQYFGVVVTFDWDESDPQAFDFLKPGQRVRATIFLDRQDDALVVPRQAIFDEDGRSTVFRRTGGGFEKVPVEVGTAGLGVVVVAEGLREGDEVALRRPPSAGLDGATETATPAGAQARSEAAEDTVGHGAGRSTGRSAAPSVVER